MDKIVHDSETPTPQQQVVTACAFIHHRFEDVDSVFLARRAAVKRFLPHVYELPGGHIKYGEDLISGLRREISEELSVDISIGDPFAAFTYMNPLKGSHSIEVVYFAKFEGAHDAVQLNSADHSAYGWFAEGDLDRATTADKSLDDPEFQATLKGFRLLRGGRLAFG